MRTIQQKFEDYYSNVGGNKDDAAYQFVMGLKKEGKISNDEANKLFENIRKIPTKEEVRLNLLKEAREGKDVLDYIYDAHIVANDNIENVFRDKYGDIPVEKLIKVRDNMVESGEYTPKQAKEELLKYYSEKGLPSETLKNIKKLFDDLDRIDYGVAGKSMVKAKMGDEVLKTAVDIKVKEADYTGLYTEYGMTPEDVSIGKKYDYMSTLEEDYLSKIPEYGNLYKEAREYIDKNKFTNLKEAIGSFVYDKFGVNGIPKSKQKIVSTVITEAAKRQIKQNIIDDAIPKFSEYVEQTGQDVEQAAWNYFGVIDEIMKANNVPKEHRYKVAKYLEDVKNLIKEEQDKPAVVKTILDIADIPLTNSFMLGIKEAKVNYEIKKLLANTFKNLYSGEYYEPDLYEYKPETEIIKKVGLWTFFVLTGMIGKELASGKQLLRALAYETVDQATLGTAGLTKNIGKRVAEKIKFEKELMKYGEEADRIIDVAMDGLEEEIRKIEKTGLDANAVRNTLKEFMIREKALGREIPASELVDVIVPITDRMYKFKVLENYKDVAKENLEKIYGREIEELAKRGLDDPMLLNSGVAYAFNKNAGSLFYDVRKVLGDEEAKKLYSHIPQAKSFDFIDDINRLYGDEPDKIAEIAGKLGDPKIKKWYRTTEEKLFEDIEKLQGVADSENFSRDLYRSVLKTIKTNLEEKYGATGRYAAFLFEKIEREAGNYAAQMITKSQLNNTKYFRELYIKEDLPGYIEKTYGKISDKEYKSLKSALDGGERKFNEFMRKKLHKIQLDSTASEGMKKLLQKYSDNVYGEIGREAERLGFRVYDREKKEALRIVKRNDNYYIINKKTNYVYAKAYTSASQAREALEEIVSKPFQRRELYAPLYLDFKKVKKEIDKVAEHLLKIDGEDKAEFLYEVLNGDGSKNEFLQYILDTLKRRDAKLYDEYMKADGVERAKILSRVLKGQKGTNELYRQYVDRVRKYFGQYEKKLVERKYGHLQYQRTAMLPEEYYKEKDLLKQDASYLYRASKRLIEIKHLGSSDELLYTMYNTIKERLGSAAASDFWRYKDIVFSRYAYNPVVDKLVSMLATYQVLTKMTRSALAQFMQIAYAPTRGSIRAFLKGVHSLLFDGQKTKELINMIDTSLINIRGFQMREEVGLLKPAEVSLTITGMNAADKLSRYIAASTGRHYAEELVQKFAADPKKYVKRVVDMGLNPETIIRNGYKLTDDDILKAMQKFEIDTNFRHSVLDMPEFVSSRFGKFIFALQQTTIRQARFIKKFVYDELKKGNPMPLISLVSVGYITSIPYQFTKQFLNGEELEPQILQSMIDVGVVFGYFGNMLESVKYGFMPFGANVSTVENIVKIMQAALMLRGDKVVENMIREVPTAYKLVYRDKIVKRARRKREKELWGDFYIIENEWSKSMKELREEYK